MTSQPLPDERLEVVSAFYMCPGGGKGSRMGADVTEKVRALVDNGELRINESHSSGVMSELLGDPALGVRKVLEVEYRYGVGPILTQAAGEDGSLLVTRANCQVTQTPGEKRLSWQQHSGRLDGPEGYQFGDITRAAARGLGDWSEKPKTKDGYEFGDLFLKKSVRALKEVFGHTSAQETEEQDLDAHESHKHKDVAEQLNEDLKEIVEKIEANLSRLDHRLEELENKAEMDATDKSAIYRVRYGKPGSPPPLDTYRQALDEAREVSRSPLQARHVRALEGSSLDQLLKAVANCLEVASDCEKTARDICDNTRMTSDDEK